MNCKRKAKIRKMQNRKLPFRCLICHVHLRNQQSCQEFKMLQFLFQKILEIPKKLGEKLLNHNLLEERQGGGLCENCVVMVEDARSMFNELLRSARLYVGVKEELLEMLKEYSEQAKGQKLAWREYRSFIENHEYGDYGNGFTVSSLLLEEIIDSEKLDEDEVNDAAAAEGTQSSTVNLPVFVSPKLEFRQENAIESQGPNALSKNSESVGFTDGIPKVDGRRDQDGKQYSDYFETVANADTTAADADNITTDANTIAVDADTTATDHSDTENTAPYAVFTDKNTTLNVQRDSQLLENVLEKVSTCNGNQGIATETTQDTLVLSRNLMGDFENDSDVEIDVETVSDTCENPFEKELDIIGLTNDEFGTETENGEQTHEIFDSGEDNLNSMDECSSLRLPNNYEVDVTSNDKTIHVTNPNNSDGLEQNKELVSSKRNRKRNPGRGSRVVAELLTGANNKIAQHCLVTTEKKKMAKLTLYSRVICKCRCGKQYAFPQGLVRHIKEANRKSKDELHCKTFLPEGQKVKTRSLRQSELKKQQLRVKCYKCGRSVIKKDLPLHLERGICKRFAARIKLGKFINRKQSDLKDASNKAVGLEREINKHRGSGYRLLSNQSKSNNLVGRSNFAELNKNLNSKNMEGKPTRLRKLPARYASSEQSPICYKKRNTRKSVFESGHNGTNKPTQTRRKRGERLAWLESANDPTAKHCLVTKGKIIAEPLKGPVNCKCGKTYAELGSLIKHIKVLTIKRKAMSRCNLCWSQKPKVLKRFARWDQLKQHVLQVHEKLSIKCQICGKQVQYFNLNQHMRGKRCKLQASNTQLQIKLVN